jgi:hypothetical protein
MTFGSPLSVPATMNTTESLGYLGTYTSVPPSPDAPNGRYHTNHWGADTAIWNTALAAGNPAAPATGQAVKVRLEGCAQPAARGPAPLTQFHLQDFSPVHGGGVHVNLTSQPLDIPVCGQNGASESTVTTYEPMNLCVTQGDYVAFNDEGGYVPYVYRSGVPYQVIGNVQGSTMDSFIRGNGTNNGATLSPSDRTANDGFAENRNEELMLQVILGTGPDATHICPGGTAGMPAALPPIRVRPQTDGVNHSGFVAVAIYCRPSSGCAGVATLSALGASSAAGRSSVYGSKHFTLRGNQTGHVRIHVNSRLIHLLRARAGGVSATLTAVVGGQPFTETIGLRIF